VHVIDVAERDPAESWAMIDRELRLYGAGLDERRQIVVLNKIDLLPEPSELDVEDDRILRVLPVSAATGAGIDRLRLALFELCPAAEEPRVADAEGLVDFLVYRPRPGRAGYRILRTNRGFRVVGSPPAADELETALRGAGAKTGDEVTVGDEVLELG
jgi:GTPase